MAIRTFRPGLFSALLACMSLASLAPLLVLEGSRFEGINGEVADHHDAELLLAASSMARETLSVVEGHRRATETLALSVSLQHQPLEQLQRQLHSLRNSYGGFSYLVLMNPDGVALVAEPPAGADGRPGAGTNYADRPYVQEVQRTRAFALGGVMLGKRSGVPNAHFGVPVLDEHGALEGMLGVALELDMLGRVAAQVESTTELIRVVLLDEQGKVIWHPDPALRRSMSNLASTEIYAQRAPAPAATTGLNEAGQRVRALAVPVALRNANWRAVALLPMEHIDEEVRRTRTRIVALTLAAFAASLLLSFVFARWLANPIGQLVEVLQSIGESPVGHRPRERLVETTEVAALQGAVAGLQVRLSTQRDMRRAKEQAEESSRAKSSFLANMSHEIRTPINAIMGMTHLVLKTVLSTQQRGYLNQIGTSSRHLLGVVNDILDYSRIEAGKLSLECIRFSLEKVLRDAVAQVEQKAVAKGLALSVSIDPDVPDALMGDPLRVTQILVNFLSNAVKFTTRGTVVLRAKAAKQDADSVALELRVTDTGIGLTEQQQTLLFQSFEQADDSTTRRFGGSGLGLAICRQLATLKGGEVGVESQFGQGSTFWFRASFARALELGPAPLHSAPAVDLSALRGARILLVEDNELNQEIAVALLSDADVEVRVARDGQEALRTLEAEAFDVVLMDLQMPVMDGLEATREIRRRAPLAGLPVIAMTASAMHSERAACEEVGMNDHITKPIEPDVLFGVLSRWVRARGGTPPPRQVSGLTPLALPEVAGLDMAGALRRLRGNTALYASLLRRFVEAQRVPHDVRVALAAGDWKQARRLAHTLKASAGNIGFEQGVQAAAVLEAALDAQAPRDQLDPLIVGLGQCLVPFISSLQLQLPDEGPAAPTADQRAFEAVCQQLDALLAADDADSVELVREQRVMLSEGLGEAFPAIDEAIGQFDFEAASKLLRSALAPPPLLPLTAPPHAH